jgi:hypothetical protein
MSSPPPRRRQLGGKTLPGQAAPANSTMVVASMGTGRGKDKQPRNSRARPEESTLDVSIPCPCTPPPRLQDTRADLANTG